jgi:hypothetical protein
MSLATDIEVAQQILQFVQAVKNDPTLTADIEAIAGHLGNLDGLFGSVSTELSTIVSKVSPTFVQAFEEFQTSAKSIAPSAS